jgi:N-acylneuraminate cytidylyltransferase
MKKNKFIVVIPARGGSKRLPKKNIYKLNTKPLIAYSIEYAKLYPNLDIFVTTDDTEIAEISKQYGAKIINRPSELADDYATTIVALKHAVGEILKKGVRFDYVILLQPTNPLRPSELLEEAINIIEVNNHDSLMTVSLNKRKLGKIENNCFIPLNYSFGQRSQDIEDMYYENGLLYISKKELILKEQIIGENMYPMIIDHIYGDIDIDTKKDVFFAEYILSNPFHDK